MTNRRSRTLLAVLAAVSLLLITVDYRQGDGGPVAAVQRGALAVFTPLQEGFAAVVRPVGGFFGAIAELGTLRAQVDQLEADNEALLRRQVSLADLERQNDELRGLLEMRDALELRTTGARVIAQPPSSFEYTVLIDVGADVGLAPGMAVIDAHGLVGKLVEVTRSSARVQLVTSPESGYAVRVAATGDDGLLRGRGSRPFQLSVLDPEAEIPPGSDVVTRAFCGTSIPDGIPIGVVRGEGDAPLPGNRFLPVVPHVDFARLDLVQVVLDAPVAPCELPSDELVPAPERPRPVAPSEGLQGDEPAAEPGTVDGEDAEREDAGTADADADADAGDEG